MYFPRLADGQEVGGQKIEEIHANEEIQEMRGFLRKRRNRKEFHANKEIEEMRGFPRKRW